MITLYHADHSTCSQKVRICLAEKHLAWTGRLIDLAAKDQLAPDYLAINPNGVVPTLVHDKTVVIDSSVICEYLDEVFPNPALSPDTPGGRAVMRGWMRYLEEVATPAVRYPSFNMAFLPRFDGLNDQQFLDQQADVRPLRKGFFRRMGRQGFSDEEMTEAFEKISQTAARIDQALANGAWLVGDQFTLADVVAAPLFDRMADLGFAHLWQHRSPRVADWYTRLQSRPAFKAAFYPGTRLTEFLPIAPWSRDARARSD